MLPRLSCAFIPVSFALPKEILLRAENIKGIEEVDAVFERLWDIYKKLNDKENVKIYATKMNIEE